ncbi:glycosyltransferase family 25 protein [Acinetobacter faecalis]|uniref:glycosyltransferase family 25 protein n=1 Tax=Acinetobacter faecalis TaxID=2665161 RepID=UPI002A90D1D3|nr:glycosyltransferase family 25 protein [Acinetobacter faecalis]MDY6468059.1 glycosyltransferase family 25 protein [Acinetobacter faecalis]
MSSYQSFVISLKRANDRREHIKEQFASKNVAFDFFDAIEPSTLKQSEFEFDISLDNSDLSENEKSCFMSHFSLWNKALEENLEYVAIFEDDIYLSASSSVLLNSADWINADFIKIEKTAKSVLLVDKKGYTFKNEKYKLGVLKNAHMGAGGYILSKKGLINLITFIREQERKDHIDQMMFDWFRKEGLINIYQINPVICIQDCILYPDSQKFQTSLQWRDKQKIKLNFINKIKREVKRFIGKMLEFPYKITLNFK